MRLLHVVKSLDERLGGVPAAAAHMALAAAESNHEVVVACARDGMERENGPLRSLLVNAGVSIVDFTETGPFAYNKSMQRWLHSETANSDLVHVHGVFDAPAYGAAASANRAGVPYVLHSHGSLDPFDLRKHPVRKRVVGATAVRKMLSGAALLVTTSDEEKRRLRTFGAHVAITVQRLPYKVDGRLLAPNVRDGPSAAGCTGLFMGRVDYKKGLTYLVQALGLLSEGAPGIEVNVAGVHDTPFGDSVKALARRTGVLPRMHFVGHLSGAAKVRALREAHFFVLPSDNENYGLVLVEAAASGLPMVLSGEVYLAESFVAAGAALVSAREPRSLARSLSAVAEPRLNARMSAASKAVYQRSFSWAGVAADHVALSRRIVEASRHAR